MSDAIDMNVPKDVAVMCQDLHKMREGLAMLGLRAHILDRVSDKLRELAEEVERVRSDRQYIIGHCDGWNAAMATGLVGEAEEPD